jgi:hypothetical protein
MIVIITNKKGKSKRKEKKEDNPHGNQADLSARNSKSPENESQSGRDRIARLEVCTYTTGNHSG